MLTQPLLQRDENIDYIAIHSQIAMKEVQSMKLPPPPPPPSRPGSTAQQKKKKPRRVPSNTKPAHPETLMLQGPAVIYDKTTKSTTKTEGVDNPVE